MDRLSPLDASFLHIEDDVNHMHIGSIGIFEGPPPTYPELARSIAGRLALVPRYRQKVSTVPLSLARPVWTDDPHFNIEYHVRHTALPAPGGEDELRRLVGRLMSLPLDRAKPLWEIWMVEGLHDGCWAMVSKVHHCLVDGVSGTELLAVILDLSPDAPPPVDDDWRPAPEPSTLDLVRDAATGFASSPYEQARAVGSVVRRPRRLLDSALEVAKGSLALSSIVRPTPPTSLNGPIGPHRRYEWATAGLDDIKTVRATYGGTVNDVVLALITRGFRDLLLARGEDVSERVIRTLVPVSVRPRGATGTAEGDGTLTNKVSAMFAELPVGLDDPVERLHSITDQLAHLKQSKQALAGEALTSLGGFAPAMLLTLGMRVATRAARRMGNLDTVTTNVPGPQFPLYCCGRRLLKARPYVPLAAPLRVGVAIFSYDGEMSFGITGDYDTAADIGVLADGISEGMAELLPTNGHRVSTNGDTPARATSTTTERPEPAPEATTEASGPPAKATAERSEPATKATTKASGSPAKATTEPPEPATKAADKGPEPATKATTKRSARATKATGKASGSPAKKAGTTGARKRAGGSKPRRA